MAQCESVLNPAASNGWGAGHYGLFQISGIHAWKWPDFWESWSDPYRNAQWAYEMSGGGTDWGAWTCKP